MRKIYHFIFVAQSFKIINCMRIQRFFCSNKSHLEHQLIMKHWKCYFRNNYCNFSRLTFVINSWMAINFSFDSDFSIDNYQLLFIIICFARKQSDSVTHCFNQVNASYLWKANDSMKKIVDCDEFHFEFQADRPISAIHSIQQQSSASRWNLRADRSTYLLDASERVTASNGIKCTNATDDYKTIEC